MTESAEGVWDRVLINLIHVTEARNMTEPPVRHEEIERVFETAPKNVLTRLGDSVETRAAREHLAAAADLLHAAVEHAEADAPKAPVVS